MRIMIMLLLSTLNFTSFAQIGGLYKIQLLESYDNNGQLSYASQLEGVILINENGSSITAKKIKNDKPYFNIIKNGSIYRISNYSEVSKEVGIFNSNLFNGEEIKLKLTDDKTGWYTTYTLQRLNDKREIYSHIKQGTGFFISSNGDILTNYHVIANSQLITVLISDKEFNCETVFKNEVDDIAIIRLKDMPSNFRTISFATENARVGDDIIALGFPLASTMGNELKISSGIISSSKGFEDNMKYFQVSAPIDPGNSGGPVLNKAGNLIGLITAKYTYATNVGYALNLTDIIKNIPIEVHFKRELKPHIISNSDIYKKYKNSVVLIKSYSL